MPEIRLDPLSGHRTIVAGERSRRPGGEPRCDPPEPIDVERDPFAEGHEDRTPPELYAVRPDGGPADSPGWTVRVVPNLYPALEPDAAEPEGEHPGDGSELFVARAAVGAHEVIVNGPQSVLSLAEAAARAGGRGGGGVAGAHAGTPRRLRICATDRQRAP